MSHAPHQPPVGVATGAARFGELLRHYRLAAGLTQRELAERAGLSLRAVNALETGERQAPHQRTTALLADVLALAPEDRAALIAAARPSPVAGVRVVLMPPAPTARRDNLPAQSTPLLGRERELAEVAALARGGQTRLITLTGPGGVGKTHLALAVAQTVYDDDATGNADETFPDGVWFVRLAPLSNPALVVPSIAQVLGLSERGGVSSEEQLRAFLHEKSLLVLLDNFEHVAAAAPQVAELLEASAGLTLLVTSRAALRLRSESTYPVSLLAVPPVAPPAAGQRSAASVSAAQLDEYAATALFVQRARAAQPSFPVTDATAPLIAAICARLDGLPLAIELAAAWARLLPPAALLARLQRQTPLLASGPVDLPERQQTMRNTIIWSENLLGAEEQRLFRRMAVFVDGCTLEAAEAVCQAPLSAVSLRFDMLAGLGALVDQNLVSQRPVGDAQGSAAESDLRFDLLQVIREYALGQLEASGEAEALRQAHAEYFRELAERLEPEAEGRLDVLEREHDNLRAALGWARARGAAETGLRLAAAVLRFWLARGHLREGRAWLEGMLALADEHDSAAVPAAVRAHALHALGTLSMFAGDFAAAQTQLEQALPLARAASDLLTAESALSNLGRIAQNQGDLARARACFEESLALNRALGNARNIAGSLTNLGSVAYDQDDLEQSEAATQEALALFRQAGNLRGSAICLANLGEVARRRGAIAQAEELAREALRLFREVGDPRRCAEGLEVVASMAGAAGKGTRAARLLGVAAVQREALGAPQPANERADVERAVAPARAALGEQAWAEAFAAGQALSLEEAITEALAEQPPASEAPSAPTVSNDARSQGASVGAAQLTPRELEVLRLLAQGRTDAQIADELVISPRTVNHHTESIYSKLGVSSRAAATRVAVERRLL